MPCQRACLINGTEDLGIMLDGKTVGMNAKTPGLSNTKKINSYHS